MALTKVDVDENSAREKFNGVKGYEVKLGTVGLVNSDSNDPVSMDMEQLEAHEREFFGEKFNDIADQHGIDVLEHKLLDVGLVLSESFLILPQFNVFE